MRGANTPNLLHHRHIPPRTITEKCPVFAPAAVDYVIDRSRTQNWSRLNMPVFHNILSLFPNAVAKVSLRQIRAGNLLPHPCEARRDNYTPSPRPKTSRNQGLWNRETMAEAILDLIAYTLPPLRRACRQILETHKTGTRHRHDAANSSSVTTLSLPYFARTRFV